MKISRKNIAASLLIGVPVLLPLIVWQVQARTANPSQIQMYPENALMEQELAHHIPLGTHIKKAQIMMQRNGFGCALEVDSKYRSNWTVEQASKSGKKTSLLCFKRTGWVWGGQWTVTLPFKEGKVIGYESFYRPDTFEI